MERPVKRTVNHTPTPWYLVGKKDVFANGSGNLQVVHVAKMVDAFETYEYETKFQQASPLEQNANARYLVKAANAHKALVMAALKSQRVLTILKEHPQKLTQNEAATEQHLIELVLTAIAEALKLAKGE